jgi:hypothetical protein
LISAPDKSAEANAFYEKSRDNINNTRIGSMSSIIGTDSVNMNIDGTLTMDGSLIGNIKDGKAGSNLTIVAGDLVANDIKTSINDESEDIELSGNISGTWAPVNSRYDSIPPRWRGDEHPGPRIALAIAFSFFSPSCTATYNNVSTYTSALYPTL